VVNQKTTKIAKFNCIAFV